MRFNLSPKLSKKISKSFHQWEKIHKGIKYDLSKMYWMDPPDKDYDKIYEWFESVGLPQNTLVHVGHCWPNCKYGDEDCPVMLGRVRPIFYYDWRSDMSYNMPGKSIKEVLGE